jgi:hypothetical protein
LDEDALVANSPGSLSLGDLITSFQTNQTSFSRDLATALQRIQDFASNASSSIADLETYVSTDGQALANAVAAPSPLYSLTAVEDYGARYRDTNERTHAVIQVFAEGVGGAAPGDITIWLDFDDGYGWVHQGSWNIPDAGESVSLGAPVLSSQGVQNAGSIWAPTDPGQCDWKVAAIAGIVEQTSTPPSGYIEYDFTVAPMLPCPATDVTAAGFIVDPSTGLICQYLRSDPGVWTWNLYELDWTQPSFATDSNYWFSFLAVQKGYEVGGVWHPAPDAEGQDDAPTLYNGQWITDSDKVQGGTSTPGTVVRVLGGYPPTGSFPLALNVDGSPNLYRTFRFWIYAVSTLGQNPAGGVNVYTLQTCWPGNADHFDVTPVEQPDGLDLSRSITGSLTVAAFASGIRPVAMFTSNPTLPDANYPAGSFGFNTVTHLFLRVNDAGTAWIPAVNGTNDVVANSITAATIAAGAIGTTELSTTEIHVGGGVGKPGAFAIDDAAGNQFGYVGMFGKRQGIVSTNGTAVDHHAGDVFVPEMAGMPISINGVIYTVLTYNSSVSLTLATSAGVQTYPPGVIYIGWTGQGVWSTELRAGGTTPWNAPLVANSAGISITAVSGNDTILLNPVNGLKITNSALGSEITFAAAKANFKWDYWVGPVHDTSNAYIQPGGISVNQVLSGGVTVNYSAAYGAAAVLFNSVQVLTARQQGWSSPSGTASRATFDPSTVTLEELAKRVKALLDDLMTHGMIGP